MKLYLLILLCVATACSNSKTIIKGDLVNAEDQTVYLSEKRGKDYHKIDSTQMNDGKFTFVVKGDYPRPGLITYSSSGKRFSIITIEPGTLFVKGDFIPYMQGVKVFGTPTVDKRNEYYKVSMPLMRERFKVGKEYSKLDRANMTPKEIEDKEKDIDSRYKVLDVECKRLFEEAFNANIDNVFSAVLLADQNPNNYDKTLALIERLSPKMPKSGYIDNLYILKEYYNTLKIGAIAPDITLKTVDDKDISLSSLRGQVVLVDFWASWCSPCRLSNPAIVELYNKYNKSGFTVFGISLDNKKEDWISAIEKDKLNWYHGSDLKKWNSEVVKLYNIDGIPQTFLLDREGRIVGVNLKGEELENKLKQLLSLH